MELLHEKLCGCLRCTEMRVNEWRKVPANAALCAAGRAQHKQEVRARDAARAAEAKRSNSRAAALASLAADPTFSAEERITAEVDVLEQRVMDSGYRFIPTISQTDLADAFDARMKSGGVSLRCNRSAPVAA